MYLEGLDKYGTRAMPEIPASDRYRIGAVSRLTGIPAVTLRAWERRYGAVEAQRDRGGSRLYTSADVERLVLIKRLVDMGNAISTVATLPLDELRARIESDRAQIRRSHETNGGPRTVAVAGVALAERLRDAAGSLSGLELLSAQDTQAELRTDLHGKQVDVLVLEYATLHKESLEEIRRMLRETRAARAVVVYGFARRALVDTLEADDIVALAAPVNLAELRLVCLAADVPVAPAMAPTVPEPRPASAADPELPLPARLFSGQALQRLSAASSSIECECPHHLSTLIRSLVGFELYSAECESRNEDDAALHAYLHRTTATARSMMEQALMRVATAEGLLEG